MQTEDSHHVQDDSEDDFERNHSSSRLEAFQLTTETSDGDDNEDEEETMVLSHRFGQPRIRRGRSLPSFVLFFFSIASIAIFVVVVRTNNPQQKQTKFVDSSTTDSSTTTIAADTTPSVENGSLSEAVVSVECPKPSTKSSDSDFLLGEDWKIAGCHRMECVSSSNLLNTRDRLGHNAPLCKGQALCNGDEERYPGVLFQFGVAPNGDLVWQKCNPLDPLQTEVITLFKSDHNEILLGSPPDRHTYNNATTASSSSPSSLLELLPKDQQWFQMTPEATWQMVSITDQERHSSTTTTITATPIVVWEQPVQNQPRPVEVTPKCLRNNPVLDCPYIHFRRHGDIVMNYIDAQDGWVACKSRKICYSSLWES